MTKVLISLWINHGPRNLGALASAGQTFARSGILFGVEGSQRE